MLPLTLWRMSSGFGPRSRSRLLGSDRPGSACTVSCVSSGVLSRPLPSEYCTLNESPLANRFDVPIVSDLNVERSEERRVGKEGRSRVSAHHGKKKKQNRKQ